MIILYLISIGTYMSYYEGELTGNDSSTITIFDTSEFNYPIDGFGSPAFSRIN